MPADITELFENAPCPPMSVDAVRVLARGRRRRLRRRLGRGVATVAATAVLVPTAVTLSTQEGPAPTPGQSLGLSCLFTQDFLSSRLDDGALGTELDGTRWLDSGPSAAGRELRVQVFTDTCDGLAVAVTRGGSGSLGTVHTADQKGRLDRAFWVMDAVGGGVDRSGKVVPVTPVAVVLLPAGQQVCDDSVERVPSDPSAVSLPLSTPTSVAAGDGWTATFGGLPPGTDPESAALGICEGDRVLSAAQRPIGSPVPLTATINEDTGDISLPIDAYWPSQRESEELSSAQRVQMTLCKRSKGAPSIDPVRRTIPDAPARPFGVWRMQDARHFGYLVPTSKAKRDALKANAEGSTTLSPAEVAAAEQCVHEDPILRVLNQQPEDGPWSTALSAADSAARSSKAWNAVVEDWASCLEEAGVPVDRESLMPRSVDTQALDDGRVRRQDVALAVADVTCKQKTDYIERLTNIVSAAQAPWIEKYRTQYQEQRAVIDKQLALARQVLDDAKL